jgi:vancomycin resistance protein YoaR
MVGSTAWPAPGDQYDPSPLPDRVFRRRLALGGLIALVLLVVLYVAAAWVLSARVPRGTTVGGLDLGGLRAAEAERELTAAYQRLDGVLPVRASGTEVKLDLPKVGLTVDPAATVDELTGFSLNPASLWRHARGGDVRPVGSPAAGLSDQLNALKPATDRAPRDAAVTFTAQGPKLRDAVIGSSLQVGASAALIEGQWLVARGPLTLPTARNQPLITQEKAAAALSGIAEPAVSGPLELTVGDRTVTVSPAQLASALSLKNVGGELRPAVDGKKLRHAVLDANPGLGVEPKDARIVLSGGRPTIVPGVAGTTIDATSLSTLVLPVLQNGAQRSVTVRTVVEQPELTTAQARKLGVKERVSTFSTNLTSNPQRTENLRIAARTVNGTLVRPGETFSLNAVLGQRTAAKGYNQAPTIQGGRLVPDYGGGVSQMATTIFNNVFFAGLQDITHKAHSFYIPRYPEGREATVNFPTVDLRWRNDSKYGVLVQASVDSQVHVSFWSTKVWDIKAAKGPRTNVKPPKTVYDDSDDCVDQDPSDGFDVSVTRTFRRPGSSAVVRTQTFRTHYIPEDDVICGPKPR